MTRNLTSTFHLLVLLLPSSSSVFSCTDSGMQNKGLLGRSFQLITDISETGKIEILIHKFV